MSEKNNTRKDAKSAPHSGGGPMDVELLAQIVELMAAHDLNTVDVRDGERRVILKRGAAPTGAVQLVQAPAFAAPPPAPAGPGASSAAPPAAAAADEDSKHHKITSPMVGTFYAAPKPGEKPFVGVGSHVSEDSDVCIIEAMKTFNNIKAECRGTIVKVLAQDGQPVEFGSVLFLVKP